MEDETNNKMLMVICDTNGKESVRIDLEKTSPEETLELILEQALKGFVVLGLFDNR